MSSSEDPDELYSGKLGLRFGNVSDCILIPSPTNCSNLSPNGEMEFTRLNTSTENDNEAGEWHLVTTPRSGLQRENVGKTEGQQDQLQRDVYSSLPRAHFLRPGCFYTPKESSAFSPYRHDLSCKGEGLKDESPENSEHHSFAVSSFSPHPLAQPGFYSPRIPRSKHCQSSLSTANTPNGSSSNKSLKEFCSHTLPLPRTKRAVVKQSGLCSKPQGIQTSLVQKPHLMKAVISQTSAESNQANNQVQNFKNNDVQSSSKHQPQPNTFSTGSSRKDKFIWKHYGPLVSKTFQPTQNQTIQTSFNMEKCTQDLNTSYTLPQNRSSLDQAHVYVNLETTSYQKFSLYNENCLYDRPQSSPLQSFMTQFNSNSKDQRKTHHCKERKDSSDADSFSSNSKDISQVDMTSKNVFGQPRVIASLRPVCSPRPVRKSTVVEDLKKLIVMDDLIDKPQLDSPFFPQQTQTNTSSRHFLHVSASPSPSMLSSPVIGRRSLSRPNCLSLQSSPTVCQPRSGVAEWDRDLRCNHELLPLPNTVSDLDWNSLVSAAEAYEMQKVDNLLSVESRTLSPASYSPSYNGQDFPQTVSSFSQDENDDVFVDVPDQLSRLELTLRRLSNDLLKEKKDKVALLAEVLKLRTSNQHLKEESLSVNAQLHRVYQMINFSP